MRAQEKGVSPRRSFLGTEVISGQSLVSSTLNRISSLSESPKHFTRGKPACRPTRLLRRGTNPSGVGAVRTDHDGIWFCCCEVRSFPRSLPRLKPVCRRDAPFQLDIEHTRDCVGRPGCSGNTGCLIQSSAVCTHSSIRRHPAVGHALAYLVSIGGACLYRLLFGSVSGLCVSFVSRGG